MRLKLSQKELEELAYGAIESARRLGIPLKKKKNRTRSKSGVKK